MNKIFLIIFLMVILSSCRNMATCPAYYGNNKPTLKQQRYQQYMFEKHDQCKTYNSSYNDKHWRKSWKKKSKYIF